MKKIYMTPEMEIVEMKAQQLLAFSGNASGDGLLVDPEPDTLVDDNLAPLLSGDPLSFFLQ
jgi:hypothetical protein